MLRDALMKAGLSNREAEVAEQVSKGLSNKEVAERLFVTEKTIKFHLTNIYKKMSIRSRAQLIVWCLPHLGFVEDQTENSAPREDITQAAAPVANGNATNVIPAGRSTVAEISQDVYSPFGNREPGSENSGGSNVGSIGA